MLTKAFQRAKTLKPLANATRAFAYTKETEPFVFINQHTKVLVQGMTGKHVSHLSIV